MGMTILDCLKNMRDRGWLLSRERNPLERPSNAELKRWCQKQAVVVYPSGYYPSEGFHLGPDDGIPNDAEVLVLFPKGKTITMPFPWGVMGSEVGVMWV